MWYQEIDDHCSDHHHCGMTLHCHVIGFCINWFLLNLACSCDSLTENLDYP